MLSTRLLLWPVLEVSLWSISWWIEEAKCHVKGKVAGHGQGRVQIEKIAYVSQPAPSTGNKHDFALYAESRISGVHGRVDVAMHGLC